MNYFQTPSQLGVRPAARLSTGLVSQALAWMFAGLAITAVVSWFVSNDASLAAAAQTLFLPGIIVQLVLVVVIADYEAKQFTIEKASGVEVLRELMDANGLRQKDLADDLGGESIVSLILKEKRN